MADKKTNGSAPEQEQEQLAQKPLEQEQTAQLAPGQEQEAVQKPKTETLLVPLDPNGASDSVFLCVNGKSLLVRRGEPVEVAPAFAEAYRNSQRQEAAAMRAKQAAMSR